MQFQRLEKNISDVVKEEQIKLGYRSETIRLYYPLSSLNRFLEEDFDADGMCRALAEFSETVEDKWGKIEISYRDTRFCLTIPPQGVDYIHDHMADNEFIKDFIRTIEKHGCTLDDLLQQFYRYSDCVHVEKTEHGEFDYLIYFEDGIPDSFRYCITDEGCHMIYHRFTPDDYHDFGFDEN